MVEAIEIIVSILLVFTALGLACAVAIALKRDDAIAPRRDAGIGRRGDTPPADPFFHPFGEMPRLPDEAVPNLRRRLTADDFRAWRVPTGPHASATACLRKEDGGRRFPSGSAVVLTFHPTPLSRHRHG